MNVAVTPQDDSQSDALPPTVTFEIDTAQRDRVRKELLASYGGKMSLPIYLAQVVIFALQPVMRFVRYGFQDAVGWVLIAIMLGFVALIAVYARSGGPAALYATVRSGRTTTVDFEDSGIGIGWRTRKREIPRRFVPITKIRSVGFLADAIVVGGKFGPLVVIPCTAFPDGGVAIESYFEARLIGKRMLRRSAPRSRSIANTRYP